jgi:hypothetical protein
MSLDNFLRQLKMGLFSFKNQNKIFVKILIYIFMGLSFCIWVFMI